jgi:hypothetical protein
MHRGARVTVPIKEFHAEFSEPPGLRDPRSCELGPSRCKRSAHKSLIFGNRSFVFARASASFTWDAINRYLRESCNARSQVNRMLIESISPLSVQHFFIPANHFFSSRTFLKVANASDQER